MTVAPNPVLIHRSRLPFRYPRRSLLRWYGPAANTSASSASANFNITSRTLPRNASLNRSGPKRPSIWLKHCILFPIGVFLLGLTLPMSQILFWDTERIRLLYFPQQAGRRQLIPLDVAQGVNYLKNTQHMSRIILYGNSGGGVTMSFYQAVAENGPSVCQGPRKLVECSSSGSGSVAGLTPADGIILSDGHPGNPILRLRSI